MNDELIIALVEQCPHLYNRSLKEWKDDKLKENSWISIAERVQLNVGAVKKRWENLRDRFVRAYRDFSTQPPTGSAGGSKKSVDFMYFQAMLWLAPFIRKRMLTSSVTVATPELDSVELESSIELENDIADDVPSPTSETYVIGADGVLSPASTSSLEYSEMRPSSSQSYSTPPPKPKAKIRCIRDTMTNAIDNFNKICEARLKQDTYRNTSDLNFMKSVVDDMQVLTPTQKVQFKTEVMEVLRKYVEEQ